MSSVLMMWNFPQARMRFETSDLEIRDLLEREREAAGGLEPTCGLED
jgi:hypothetical protein